MLDTIREHSRSTIIYVLFGIIIIVFVFTFNTGGGKKDCASTDGAVAMLKVAGQTLDSSVLNMGMALTAEEPNPFAADENAMRRAYLYNHTRFPQAGGDQAYALYMPDAADISPLKVERVADDLAETWLASEAAKALGMYVTDDELRARVYSKEWYDEEGKFRKDEFEGYVHYALQTSISMYESFLEREMLRDKMIDVVTAGVAADPDEIAYYFDQQNTKVDLEFAEIDPARFAADAAVTDDEIDAVLANRGDEAKKYYDEHAADFKARSFLFRGVRLAFDATTQAAVAAQADALHAELAALTDAKAQDDRLASAAAAQSSHDSKANGGLLADYVASDALAAAPFGAPLLAALTGLADGALSSPVAVDGAVWIVKRVGAQEGETAPFDGVKRRVAEAIARADKAPEAAKAFVEKVEAWLAQNPTAPMADVVAFLNAQGKGAFTSDETGAFARMSFYTLGQDAEAAAGVPKIGVAPQAMETAFQLTADKPLSAKVVKVESTGRFVALRLKERTTTEGDEAAKARTELKTLLDRMAKRNTWLAWYRAQKARAVADGKLEFTDDFQRVLAADKKRFEEALKKGALTGDSALKMHLPSGGPIPVTDGE